MFGGWLPSVFGRGRGTDPTDEDSSDSPRAAVSEKKSKSRDSKKSTSSNRVVEDDLLVAKWTVACLNSVMLPARQELSGVFAPLPLLALFCVVWMAATDEVRKHMKAVCGIDKTNLKAFSVLLSRIIPSLNKDSLMIYRILITPDQTHTIDPIFTTKLEKRFGRRTILPADRDKQRDYIRTNTKRMISDLVIPSSSGLLGFAAVSVAERWQAETRPYPDRPFALNNQQKQLHGCFELRGAMRMLNETRIDSCLLPFSDSSLALAILRPTERGGIVRLSRELTAKELHSTLKKLGEQTSVVSRVLLPRVELRSCTPSLLPKWRLSGVLSERGRPRRKGGERVCPQFREIAAGASIRIDERGVHSSIEEGQRARTTSSSSSVHSYYSAAIDSSLDPNFNLRFDSPFLFFVVHRETMTPILAGTYAGSALITPYNHSVSVSESKSSKSLARKSIDVSRRLLKKVRKSSSSTKSSRESSNSEEKKTEEKEEEIEKEWKGVPKCEECEKRSGKSGKSEKADESVKPTQPIQPVQQTTVVAAAAPLPVVVATTVPATSAVSLPAATPTETSVRVATPPATTPQPSRQSVRETLKETRRSTSEGAYRTLEAGRATTHAAKDGIVKAAKISGEKIGKGFDKTKQTAVRIAGKSSEKLGKAKKAVSSTAKSIGRAIRKSPVMSRTRSVSRSDEEDGGEKSTKETRENKVPDRSSDSEGSSRKAKTSSRATAAKPSSVTRSNSKSDSAEHIEEPPAAKSVAAADAASKPQTAKTPTKTVETSSSFEASKAKAKSTGREVARNVRKGLSKAKGSMKKFFGRVVKRSKDDNESREKK